MLIFSPETVGEPIFSPETVGGLVPQISTSRVHRRRLNLAGSTSRVGPGGLPAWPSLITKDYGPRAISPSRSYQRTVSFPMIKDVLHIMFTLVTKRKDSSF